MLELLIKYLKTWWKPLLTFIVATGIYIVGSVLESKFIFDNFLTVITVLMAIVLVSVIYQFRIKKWYFGLLQLVIIGVFWLGLSFFTFLFPKDFYADNLKIPTNVAFEKPIDLRTDVGMGPKPIDEVIEQNQGNLTFKLANGSQPGIYTYHFWYKPTDLGTLYIRAYEVTKNQELSAERLWTSSKIQITTLNQEKEVFTSKFTIFEGDWGKPYGARFEVWFKPADGKFEYKLTEKNYIIEGWMR